MKITNTRARSAARAFSVFLAPSTYGLQRSASTRPMRSRQRSPAPRRTAKTTTSASARACTRRRTQAFTSIFSTARTACRSPAVSRTKPAPRARMPRRRPCSMAAHAVRPLTIDTSRSFGNADASHTITVTGLHVPARPRHGGRAASRSATPARSTAASSWSRATRFSTTRRRSGSLFQGGAALIAATDGPDFAGGTGLFVRNNLFARNTRADRAGRVRVLEQPGRRLEQHVRRQRLDRRDARRTRHVRDSSRSPASTSTTTSLPTTTPDGNAGDVRSACDGRHRSRRQRDHSTTGTPHSDDGNDRSRSAFRRCCDRQLPASRRFAADRRRHRYARRRHRRIRSRGATRLKGAHVDIGAYEFEAAATGEAIFADGFDLRDCPEEPSPACGRGQGEGSVVHASNERSNQERPHPALAGRLLPRAGEVRNRRQSPSTSCMNSGDVSAAL